MEEFFRIGKIVKPRGVKGEVKIEPLSGDNSRFKTLKNAVIDGVSYKIEKSVVSDGIYLNLSGVTDRNAAELLRGKFVCVRREELAPLGENTFYVSDILGSAVFTENAEIGVLSDVTSAKTDIFTVKTKDGNFLRFPFLKDLIIKVDIAEKKIVLKEKRLSEVGVYEI